MRATTARTTCPVGASLSRWLVTGFLGMPVLLIVGALYGWGWALFRRRQIVFLPLLTGLTVVGAFFLACFFGWLEPRTDTALDLWSGAVGLGVAGWLESVIGAVGAFLLLLPTASAWRNQVNNESNRTVSSRSAISGNTFARAS